MAEQQAAPPADSGKIDVAAITKSVTDEVNKALKPFTDGVTAKIETLTKGLGDLTTAQGELAKNHKILGDTIAGIKPLDADAVGKLVGEKVDGLLAARQQSDDAKAEREAFIASEASGLGKLPKTYQGKLGADKAKWPEEAKAIAAEYEADFKAGGGKVADVGGASREGGKTPASEGSGGFLKMPA